MWICTAYFLDFESMGNLLIIKEKPVIMIGNVLITYIGYFFTMTL